MSYMRYALWRVIPLVAMCAAGRPHAAAGQEPVAAWLDASPPAAWNTANAPIPQARRSRADIDSRCRAQARPAQTREDELVRARGWDLVGAYQGGWQIVTVRGTAGYDGMCRPLQYQDFVFVRGVFAGTLAPAPMDSRADGSLVRVFLQGPDRVSAEYLRYSPSDPLCCASRITSVTFEISGTVVKPLSATTSPATASAQAPAIRNLASSAQRRKGRRRQGFRR